MLISASVLVASECTDVRLNSYGWYLSSYIHVSSAWSTSETEGTYTKLRQNENFFRSLLFKMPSNNTWNSGGHIYKSECSTVFWKFESNLSFI